MEDGEDWASNSSDRILSKYDDIAKVAESKKQRIVVNLDTTNES